MVKILAPTHCPECRSELTWRNDQLFCTSSTCPAKTSKAIQHFTKTAKIKGLGEKTIEKLEITTIPELYSLTLQQLEDSLGAKIGSKIFSELENSKAIPLNTLLPAFNIPLIGNSASEKLALSITSFDNVTEQTLLESGLGPKATSNLLHWIKETYPIYKELLPFSFKFETKSIKLKKEGVVCITGKLKSFKTKSLAEQALKSCGYETKSSLTKDVTILVNESGIESAKTKKARESGVTVVTNLKQLLGEQNGNSQVD